LEQALAHWKPIAYARYDRVSITACLALALRGLGRNEEAQAQWAGALKDALENRVYLGLLLVLTVAALFELDRGHVARAIELYRTVASQPLVSHSVWYTDIAGRELATAARQLPVEVAASAQQRGEKADLWQTGEQLADTIRT
jgi:hypothetical protein